MGRGWWIAMCLGLSSSAAAQDAPLLGGVAITSTSYASVSGTGQSLVAAQRILGRGALTLRTDLRLHRAQLNGSPQACVLVEQIYCFGRDDQLASGSLGLATALRMRDFGKGTVYALPLQLALRHSRATIGELRGPTLICIVGGDIVSCPDNPPFEHRESAWTATGLEVAAGIGLRYDIQSVSLHVESRFVSIPGPTQRGQSVELSLMLGRRLARN